MLRLCRKNESFGLRFRFRVRAQITRWIGCRLVYAFITISGEDDTQRTGIDELGHGVVLTQFEHIACSDYVGVIELAISSSNPHFGGDVEYNLTTFDGSREAVEISQVAAKAL